MPDLDYINESIRHLAVPLAELNADPDNHNLHDERSITTIMQSLREFTQDIPVVVQRAGMIVRKGNGRLEAAKRLGWTHLAAVVVDDDTPTAIARAVMDNQSARLSTFSPTVLSKIAASLTGDGWEAEEFGFTTKELKEVARQAQAIELAGRPVVEDEPPIDKAAELQVKWGTKLGDLWLIPSLTVPPRRVVVCPCCGEEQEVEA
jgi:ParB-like chromosome segregation protein Spo0J